MSTNDETPIPKERKRRSTHRRRNDAGSIWKEGKVWKGRIVSPVTGKPKKVTGRTYAIVDEKLKEITALEAPTNYTVRRAAEEWLTLHVKAKGMYRPTTRRQYEQMLILYVYPLLGDKAVEDVTSKDVQQVIVAMAEKDLATSTMGHARKVMHLLYAWMQSRDIVATDPCRKIRIPENDKRPRKSLSPSEVVTLLDAMKGSRWEHAIWFDLLTGLRRGELLALRWEDIEDGWINVCRTRDDYGNEGPPKSEAGIRRIKVGKAIEDVLKAQKAMLVLSGTISPYVFPAKHGGPAMPNGLNLRIHRISRKVGLEFSIHELRHTFVSIFGRDMDLKTLQSVLGHSSSTPTMDLYAHLVDDSLETAAKEVDVAVSRIEEAREKLKAKNGISNIPSNIPQAKNQ